MNEEFDLSRKKLWLRDYDLDYLKEQVRKDPEVDDCVVMWKFVEEFLGKEKLFLQQLIAELITPKEFWKRRSEIAGKPCVEEVKHE